MLAEWTPLFMMRDSSTVNLSSSSWPSLSVIVDRDRLNHALRLGTREVNRQQPVFQIGAQHLHSVRQHECALELTGGNSAVQIVTRLLVVLPAANHELTFFNCNIELFAGEPGNRERDAEPLGLPIFTRHAFDVVRWVPVGSLRNTIERPFDFIEAKQKRAR